jgi:hypothetical protein
LFCQPRTNQGLALFQPMLASGGLLAFQQCKLPGNWHERASGWALLEQAPIWSCRERLIGINKKIDEDSGFLYQFATTETCRNQVRTWTLSIIQCLPVRQNPPIGRLAIALQILFGKIRLKNTNPRLALAGFSIRV